MWIPLSLIALSACAEPASTLEPVADREAPSEAVPIVEPAPAPATLRDAAAAADIEWPPPNVRIVVDKSDRLLHVWSDDTELVQWPVALGGHLRDKVKQGDSATPEGEFRIVTRNDKSRFHLFLGLNYPLTEDADRGVAAGLITPSQAESIRRADAKNALPNWNTRLGGAIGIHGGGSSADWTLGCIAVENEQIEEIWAATKYGAKVRVQQ